MNIGINNVSYYKSSALNAENTNVLFKGNENSFSDKFNSKISENTAYYGKDLVKSSSNKIPEDLKILFQDLDKKEGKDFADAAYKGLIKHYGLEGLAPDKLEWEATSKYKGQDIVSDYQWYSNKVVLYEDLFLGSGKSKEEQLGFIAHEVTHMKQLTNIMQTDGLPLTTVATAFAIFDFNTNMANNPVAQRQYAQAKQNGKEKEFTKFLIGQIARKNYGELSVAFKDALIAPKHPLNSPLGQKALKDLDAWSKYSSANWDVYSNNPIEKEAMEEENNIRAAYKEYSKQK